MNAGPAAFTGLMRMRRRGDEVGWDARAGGADGPLGEGRAWPKPGAPRAAGPWALEQALADAVAGDDIEARYRPVFHLASGHVVGTEAVAALPGTLDVAIAAPLAELGDRPELLRPVLDRLVERVLAELADPVPVALRWWVSIGFDDGFVASPAPARALVAILERAALPRDRFVVELSEAALSRGVRNGTVAHLAAAGVRFAVADFGSAHLVPSDLRRVPMAYVRVPLGGLSVSDPYDVDLIRSVVAAADALAIPVLGDGVERDDQLDLVHQTGIGLVQGYRWGSAGPLAKLIGTWGREGV